METAYEILVSIVGQPANDYQAFVLYTTACAVSTLAFFAILHLFRLIAGMPRFGRR